MKTGRRVRRAVVFFGSVFAVPRARVILAPIPIEPDDRQDLLTLLLQLLADAVLKGVNELNVDEAADVFPETPSELVEAMDGDNSWTVSENEAKEALEVPTEGEGEASGLEGDTEGETQMVGGGEPEGKGSVAVCAAPAVFLVADRPYAPRRHGRVDRRFRNPRFGAGKALYSRKNSLAH